MITKLLAIVANNTSLPASAVKLSTRLEELGVDSLEYMEMILEIQSAFGVDIPDEVIGRLTTVEDILNALTPCQV